MIATEGATVQVLEREDGRYELRIVRTDTGGYHMFNFVTLGWDLKRGQMPKVSDEQRLIFGEPA